ncbi:sugar phosphate isomerase/epimerase family protein [uncultured Sphaerochaeta sp.]|uniref:sugar phosphate isomerase/epimerase family protein n=1 Tax=uncultured Sphaerochaeta sp. TaxID=886478 RepID=UPI002A0A610A|nr:sugar phosphate isomerase/epimerase family protein [uncultured Sphaerochaeta sp.]
MKEPKFSINTWLFGTASMDLITKAAHEIGVDGIDISGEPDAIDLVKTKELLEKYNLKAFCINGNYSDENRVICHSDATKRASAIQYCKALVDMALALGSKRVLVVPSQVNRVTYFIDKEADFKNASESLKEIAAYAESKDKDLRIIVECVNQYEVALIRTVADGIALAKSTGYENVRIVPDTFHMQLEEKDGIPGAIRSAGNKWIKHLHLGDNTREVPGKGCMDWRAFMIAIDDIKYEDALSFEPLPGKLTGDEIFADKLDTNLLIADLKYSFAFLKSVCAGIRY